MVSFHHHFPIFPLLSNTWASVQSHSIVLYFLKQTTCAILNNFSLYYSTLILWGWDESIFTATELLLVSTQLFLPFPNLLSVRTKTVSSSQRASKQAGKEKQQQTKHSSNHSSRSGQLINQSPSHSMFFLFYYDYIQPIHLNEMNRYGCVCVRFCFCCWKFNI